MSRKLPVLALVLALVFAVVLATGPARAEGEVNVYSYRQPQLIKPLFDAFTAKTGIAVNVVFAKNGLIQRLLAEGRNSPADILLTVDIGRMNDAVEAGLTAGVLSPELETSIPEHYRHPDGHWYGLTARARILYVSKDRVAPGELENYEQLADPKWRGRICTRSGKHVYNVALIASMIARHGEVKAQAWLDGVKANLARRPQGNDRAQIKAIHQGECDIALGNHYYFGRMLANPDQKPWADAVRLVFPNQGDRGTHVNISGTSLTRSAPNRANAVRLLTFLASAPAQKLYAELNHEYPTRLGVAWSPIVEAWGKFSADKVPLAQIAELRPSAVRMVDRVGFDD